MRTDEIRPYERNPRHNDEAVGFVAESIRRFGFRVPIVIDAGGVIVCGHTRYKAALALEMTEVPCVVADDLAPEQIKAFRIADNRVAEFSEWDEATLAEELAEMQSLGIDAYGLDVDPDAPPTQEEEDAPGENGFEYREEYAINIVCDGEADQAEKLSMLRDMGYECRAVIV